MNKEKLVAIINDMPHDFDLEILMEKLIFIEKVEKGIDQLCSGNVVTHELVKMQIKQLIA